LFAQQVQTNRPFQFQEGSELVIRVHNEALTVAAMSIGNPDRSSGDQQLRHSPNVIRLC
jgi:hypothetical protein